MEFWVRVSANRRHALVRLFGYVVKQVRGPLRRFWDSGGKPESVGGYFYRRHGEQFSQFQSERCKSLDFALEGAGVGVCVLRNGSPR